MVNSSVEDRIAYFDIEGVFSADEFYAEMIDWMENRDGDFDGFIIDTSKVTKHPAMEQRKAAAYSKKYPSEKPYVVIGKDEKIARMMNIYTRFTKVEGVKYASNPQDAKEWILEQL